ncbi:hypothetical protein EEL32_06760 [Brevibacillus laterosporus]|uniref:Uncharacterized protein n=1 Tax=Brevibacillus laterosporus TaxID=1465 RepID=A0A502IU04_BRELA|nr:hypothetical protein [Brevibacillus laterosporus]QDX95436.1 hypothetical protein EEL30_26085 [Brevibacillus laterosporus]RAP17928.1 hypothetical protein C2W64_04531 [Brevibacillus laterosporus]TPG69351.1 hypothetical protein EEL31_13045 [Brevibacillus laterosporus]TPG89158.1 hypothetical protein EEL32_06760 [Brevibacillus laterosporus]
MKKQILTAMVLSAPLLISSGNVASAHTNVSTNVNLENPQLQKLSNYQTQQTQVVNIEQVTRKVIPSYARYINGIGDPNVGVYINDMKLVDVEEKYVDPDYPIRAKLIGAGPEKLVQSLEYDAYNDHSSGDLTVSHTFQHAVSNTSTFTKSITHSHKAGVKFNYKAKVDFLVAGSELGAEVAYEYTNSNQNGTSDSKTITNTISSTASAKLPPKSKGTLISNVYTSPAIYEIKSRSFFTGSVQFSYVLGSDPGTLRTKTVSLYELFARADEEIADEIADSYHMWAQTFWKPENGEPVKALLFEGTSILKIDEKYRTETRLADMKKI